MNAHVQETPRPAFEYLMNWQHPDPFAGLVAQPRLIIIEASVPRSPVALTSQQPDAPSIAVDFTYPLRATARVVAVVRQTVLPPLDWDE
jgi:hypothetical protein